MFIYRLAGIQELFLLLYLASAARQALPYCISVLQEAEGVRAMGQDRLGRTHILLGNTQSHGAVSRLRPPRPLKRFMSWTK